MCFSVNIAKFLRARILKNICEELFLKKLAASVLTVLLNAGYLLTNYKLISKKIDLCLIKKCLRWYYFKIKTNPRTHLP